jgi:hypothetical protein
MKDQMIHFFTPVFRPFSTPIQIHARLCSSPIRALPPPHPPPLAHSHLKNFLAFSIVGLFGCVSSQGLASKISLVSPSQHKTMQDVLFGLLIVSKPS